MKTDEQLKTDVMQELLWDPTVADSAIVVSVDNGIVTLSGTVPHYAGKYAAERATQRVEGVKAIAEEMEVHIVDASDRKDSDIAEAVMNSLRWHVWVPDHVHAKVEAGWVTLTGNVKWEYERSSSVDAVSYVAGVKGVTNNITLKPPVLSTHLLPVPTTPASAVRLLRLNQVPEQPGLRTRSADAYRHLQFRLGAARWRAGGRNSTRRHCVVFARRKALAWSYTDNRDDAYRHR